MLLWFYDLLRPQWARASLRDRLTNFVVLGVRKLLISCGVRFAWRDLVRGRPIWLPFHDDFSINQRLYPDYGYNLARVAAAALTKYPDFKLIDIGAAIGDNITQIRLYGTFPILAINPGVDYLMRNWGSCADVTLVDAFVCGQTSRGATLPAATNGQTPVLSLKQILEKHFGFQRAHLLKIDTDGIDCAILRDNRSWLTEIRPILFFEYDPRHASAYRDTTRDIFPLLQEIGYETAMIYGSSGVFLLSAPLTAAETWDELHHFLLRHAPMSYFDICMFSLADRDVYLNARALEFEQPSVN